ncbi:MAG: tRNA (guanosine(37)-N1)-methyltransferase TrmD, partial [Actinomycetes bacterium]
LSIGDFVLTNGALPAMVVIDAVARLLPGALGDDASSQDESFSHGLLEYPQYTRPAEFRGLEVPAVLRSGNHGEVERWRRAQSLHRTLLRRPDLIARRGGLSEEELQLLAAFGLEAPIRDETSSNSG